jgi:glycosyltransferase involved in cell wall biosynthesis
MSHNSVSIIIPAFNEAQVIGDLVSDIRHLYPDFEIIVIDDGSADQTAEVAGEAGALVYRHPYNIGNGAAIKSGIRAASGDILVFMDGDGQHNPADIQKLLDNFPEYDMVVGSRSQNGQASFGRALGNSIYNRFASYVTKFSVKDLTSGFRAVKADIARSFVYLLPNTYSYPTTITLGVLRSGNSVKYIPIRVQKRQNGNSSIKFFQDGIRFFMIITRIATMYSPMRVFLPVSFVMFLLGLLRYAYTLLSEGRFTNISALLFVSAVIIFMMSLISEQICQMRYERRSAPRAVRQAEKNRVQDNREIHN